MLEFKVSIAGLYYFMLREIIAVLGCNYYYERVFHIFLGEF
jgi:hypothetical protein